MPLWLILAIACAGLTALPPLPSVRTSTVTSDPDDPAIWRHPSDPARSLVIGTDKLESTGGVYVFGMDGTVRQVITPLDRPNNVDVEYGVRLGAMVGDIAVVTERKQGRLRLYGIPLDGGPLTDLAPSGVPVLTGGSGDASEPMGVAVYTRPRDGSVFVVVAPKGGAATNYLAQYRLDATDDTGIRATLIRRFGHFSQKGALLSAGEIEAVLVDDELGFVYYADERFGIRKWHADPDHPDATRELAVFGTEHYRGDREGLALYKGRGGKGFIVSADQIDGGSRLFLYRRDGANAFAGVVPHPIG